MATINYVIACWSGPRRDNYAKYSQDSTYYLNTHLEYLSRYQHNISQITLAISENPNETNEFKHFVESIPASISQTPVVTIRKENKSLSYGSYSHVYGLYRDQFDYYIFVEDDWVFIQNDFDTELVNMFNEHDNCGFVCGAALPYKTLPSLPQKIAAISNGITSSQVANLIWDKFGCFPTYGVSYQNISQENFSKSFLLIGKSLNDITRKYVVPYNHLGELRVFTASSWNYINYIPSDKPILMTPIQFLHLIG